MKKHVNETPWSQRPSTIVPVVALAVLVVGTAIAERAPAIPDVIPGHEQIESQIAHKRALDIGRTLLKSSNIRTSAKVDVGIDGGQRGTDDPNRKGLNQYNVTRYVPVPGSKGKVRMYAATVMVEATEFDFDIRAFTDDDIKQVDLTILDKDKDGKVIDEQTVEMKDDHSNAWTPHWIDEGTGQDTGATDEMLTALVK
jgi:hypothetical protein